MSLFVLAVLATSTPTALELQNRVADPFQQIVAARELIVETGFDPRSLFEPQRAHRDLITVAYSGDDIGWPVYSIAIREGCLTGQPWGRDCATRRTARMVRAPWPADPARPRMRGYALGYRVLNSSAASRAEVAAIFNDAGVDWLETDVAACPAAAAVVAQSGELSWVPSSVQAPVDGPPKPPTIHSDSAEVRFLYMSGTATYRGGLQEGLPGAWAVRLAEALEPCWKAASALAPWRRPLALAE